MPLTLRSLTVENFKAIRLATVPLNPGLTVLVGQNSSGKSSFLQATHWACRCVAHPRVQRNQTRSIAPQEFDYYPTDQIRRVGHNQELRQGRGENPEVSVNIILEHTDADGNGTFVSSIPLSQGNNDVVKVDLRGDVLQPVLYELLSDRDHPFSSYIPGLAGIPLTEEKRSRLPVLRQAASGDANTVLRNILLQIEEDEREGVSLRALSELCSKVIGSTEVTVDFDDRQDFRIKSTVHTDTMEAGFFCPLELAGTGVLQCVQIFAYLLLYQPKLLLIDEPDAHLHPSRQEKLVLVLSDLAQRQNASVLMTSHSPNVIRALPASSDLIWMKEGAVEERGDKVRQWMGWGVLDKKLLLITEDSEPTELREILSQWPDLERQVVVWPVPGHSSLPNVDACRALLSMTGLGHVVLHRDGDFMTPDERTRLSEKFTSDQITLYITDDSDVEAYFLAIPRIAEVSGLSVDVVERLCKRVLAENADKFEDIFARKRQMIAEDRRIYEHRDRACGVAAARNQIPNGVNGLGRIHGKLFSKRLKPLIVAEGGTTDLLLRARPGETGLAVSLRAVLDAALNGE